MQRPYAIVLTACAAAAFLTGAATVQGSLDWRQFKAASRHGTQNQGQSSDGTGVSGNCPKFNADGSLTDSGAACGGGGSSLLSSVNTFANRPASGTNTGDLFSATDSPVSSIWTGSAWQNFAFHIPVTLPTTSTFATAVNVTNSTQSNTTGPLILSDLDTNVVMRAASIPTNTAAFLFTGSPTTSNAFQFGVGFRESATGKLLILTVFDNSAVTTVDVSRWTNPTTFSASVFRQGYFALQSPVFGMRLRQAGSSIFCDVSWDAGYHWTQMYTETKTAFFTTAPDQVGPVDVQSGDVITLYNYSTT